MTNQPNIETYVQFITRDGVKSEPTKDTFGAGLQRIKKCCSPDLSQIKFMDELPIHFEHPPIREYELIERRVVVHLVYREIPE